MSECPKLRNRGSGEQQHTKGRVNAVSGYLSDSEESLWRLQQQKGVDDEF